MIHGIAVAAIIAAQLFLLLSMGMAIVCMLRGPRAQDRVLALDALYVNAMLLLLTIGIATGSMLYIEAALIIALLSFIGSAAFAKFLLRGEVIE
ncbi:MAG: K+/H+ antiporter subunit F [Salinisphaera sp.]|nr:K+/H+ antiporter subunit F [Salinisphaera sp.]